MFGSTQALGFGVAGGYSASQASPDKASQLESPVKRARQEDKQTCLPATVRMLFDAHQAQASGELTVNGVEVVNVALVGVVESLSRQAAVLEFTLNDGSGRMKVRHYSSNSGNQDSEKDGVVAGRYVSVVGGLRTAPAVHVSALTLRPVATGDEVSYHMVEVAHTSLLMKKSQSLPTPARALDGAPPSELSQIKTEAIPPPSAAPAVAAPATVAPAVAPEPAAAQAAPNLKASVLEVLSSEGESRPEGVSLSVILGRLKQMPEGGVREVLEQLVADGEAYTTIDEEHFLVL